MRATSIVAVVCAVWGLCVPARGAEQSRRMTADAVKLKGLTLLKTVDADLDGDGRKEVVAACTGDKGIQLAIIGENKEGAVVTYVAPPALGKELAKIEAKPMAPPKASQEVILELYDETPDEKVKRVWVYGGGPAPNGATVPMHDLFKAKVERSKLKDDRPEWERDSSIVAYGDTRAGWYFDEPDGEGNVAILMRQKPQILEIPRTDGDKGTAKVITGMYETKWTYDAERLAYVEGTRQLNDFLPAYTVAKVDASSAWIDPKELKELRANALSDALMKATDDGKKKEVQSDDVQIDLTPYIQRGADQNLTTAWIEDDAGYSKTADPKAQKKLKNGDGHGEWIEVTLEDSETVHMVRVVAGCVDTQQTFKSHNVPTAFSLKLDNGSDIKINRRDAGSFDSRIVAFSDGLVKLKDRPWAKQTLVFFDGKTDAKSVRVTIDAVAKQGKGTEACISEVSVH